MEGTYTAPETAKMLGYSPKTIYKLLATGQLIGYRAAAHRAGKRGDWRVLPSSVARYRNKTARLIADYGFEEQLARVILEGQKGRVVERICRRACVTSQHETLWLAVLIRGISDLGESYEGESAYRDPEEFVYSADFDRMAELVELTGEEIRQWCRELGVKI